jgi:general secretion pathway protein N
VGVSASRKGFPGMRVNVVWRGGVAALALLAMAWSAGQAPVLAAMESIDTGTIGVIEPPLPHRTPTAVATPESIAARTPAGNPLWAIPLRLLTETRDRPLFSPSRRPPPAAVVAAPAIAPVVMRPAEPDHPLLTLVGTIVGGSQGIAIFVDQASKAVIRLRTGEGHDGWTLRAVRERDVVFASSRHDAILALPARNAKDQTITAGVPPAQVPPLSDTWTDGDGQLTIPPKLAHGGRSRPSPLPATWQDGDGQFITAPVRN